MPEKPNASSLLLFRLITGAVSVFLLVTFFWWTLLPYLQLRALYADSPRGERAMMEDDFLYTPYTYAQPTMRYQILEYVFDGYKRGTPEVVQKLLPFGIVKLEEAVAREPYYPKYYLSLAKAYSLLAQEHDDNQEYYRKSAENYEKALALMPGGQEISYAYAINLINQHRADDALTIIKGVVYQDPRVAESHYYYGVILFKAGESHYGQALEEFEQSITHGRNVDGVVTRNIYTAFFSYFYRTRDITNFITTLNRLIDIDPDQHNEYVSLKGYIEAHHTLPVITIKTQ